MEFSIKFKKYLARRAAYGRPALVELFRQDDSTTTPAVLKVFDTRRTEFGYVGDLEIARFATQFNGLSVRVLAGMHEKQKLFMLTEYLPGKDLRTAQLEKVNWEPVCMHLMAAFLIHALVAWENTRIIHRDVRASNFMLTPLSCIDHLRSSSWELFIRTRCKVVVLDYSLACIYDPVLLNFAQREIGCKDRETAFTFGLGDYRAPELRIGRSALTTDVWSMGALLCRMLNGMKECSFQNGDVADTLIIPPTIPEDMSQMIAAMTKRKETDRTSPSALWHSRWLDTPPEAGNLDVNYIRDYVTDCSQEQLEDWRFEYMWSGGWPFKLPSSQEDAELTHDFQLKHDQLVQDLHTFRARVHANLSADVPTGIASGVNSTSWLT